MKMDKETLSKNGFWFGLGGFGALWLVGILALEVWGGDKGPKDTYEKAAKAIKEAQQKGPKTPEYQKPWNKYGDLFRGHKNVAWAKAWDIQKDIWFWPDPALNTKLLYPDDEFTDDERLAYRNTLYPAQFDRDWLKGLVSPAEMDRSAIVPRQSWDRDQTPTKEECWLAQEDFCVRLQVLKDLRTAMDGVARFDEVKDEDKGGKDEKLPEGVKARKRFRNRLWEIDLLLVPDPANPSRLAVSEKSTIKNVHPDHRVQPLANPRTHKGLRFRLTAANNPDDYSNLQVAGEPAPYGKAVPLQNLRKEPITVKSPDLRRAFTVTQVFEWETAPIRRIEALELGHHSHRTCTTPLVVREDLKALDPQAKEAKDEKGAESGPGGGPGGGPSGGGPAGGGPGGAGSAPPGGMMGSGGMMGGAPGGAGGGPEGVPGGQATDVTPVNKINRARYLYVTPQARHLPLAMRLVVDQANIEDVLVALANSPLRIQVTQVELHHRRDVSAGESGAESGGIFPGLPPAGGGSRGGLRGGMSPGGYGGATAGYGRAGRGGMTAPAVGAGTGSRSTVPPGTRGSSPEGTSPSESAGPAGEGAPLMELTVYGIAVLYERYPPKKKDAKAEGPSAGGTPGAASPPAASPPAGPPPAVTPPAGGPPKGAPKETPKEAPKETPKETPKGGAPGGTPPRGDTPRGGTSTAPDKSKGTTPPGPGR